MKNFRHYLPATFYFAVSATLFTLYYFLETSLYFTTGLLSFQFSVISFIEIISCKNSNQQNSFMKKLSEYELEFIFSIIMAIAVITVAGFMISPIMNSGEMELPHDIYTILIFGNTTLFSILLFKAEKNNIQKINIFFQTIIFITILLEMWLEIEADIYVNTAILIYIILSGCELFFSTIEVLIFKKSKFERRNFTEKALLHILSPAIFQKTALFFSKNKSFFNKSFFSPKNIRRIIITTLSLAVTGWLITSLYYLTPGQEGFVFRFGKVTDKTETVKPGLHLKFPWPIDSIEAVDTKKIRRMVLGHRSEKDLTLIWSAGNTGYEEYISGDNNFISFYGVLQYKIADAAKYLLLNGKGTTHLKLEATETISEIFLKNNFYDVVLDKRKEWQEEFIKTLQSKLAKLNSGVEITDFDLKTMQPPNMISSSYETVVASYQEKEKIINQAVGTKNKLLPEARSEAFSTLSKAESDAFDKKSIAEGDFAIYKEKREQWNSSKPLFKLKSETDMASRVLTGKEKFIADPKIMNGETIYIENIFENKNIKEEVKK